MAISPVQHRALVTQRTIAEVNETKVVRTGFGGFFPSETTPDYGIDISVRRGSNLIATDVMLFGDGNMNKRTKSTQKIYVPPFYKEGVNISRMDVYDITSSKSKKKKLVEDLMEVKNTMLRAIQKQQADVLQTGVVTVKNGDDIDYKRKAASMVALGSGVRWNESGSDPLKDLQTAGLFIRQKGNSSATEFNAIMGGDAFGAFLSNSKVTGQAEWTNIRRENIISPQFNEVTGMTFQGQIATNDYRMNIWTYSETYTNTVGGTEQYYLDPKKVVVLPNDFKGKTVYGGLPVAVGTGDNVEFVAKEAEFHTFAYTDMKVMSKDIWMMTRPLVIPFEIDKIYTITPLA